MDARGWIVVGALMGAMGVGMGAYHAHGLKEKLQALGFTNQAENDRDRLDVRFANFGTAVRYQMAHAPVLILIGLLASRGRSRWLSVAGGLLLFGVIGFSGMLYAWSLGGPTFLVHIVPIGGMALILGWLALAVAGFRVLRSE